MDAWKEVATTPTYATFSLESSKLDTTTMSTSRITTRFLVISDTHSAEPSQNVTNAEVSFRPPLPEADVLLHCGDLTMVGHLHEYERTLKMLEGINADLKLVIAGNHDITLDERYYERKGQYMHRWHGYDTDLPRHAKEMWTGERARKAGVTYLEEGTHTFQLSNGAQLRVSTDSHCTSAPALMIRRSTPLHINPNSATGPSRTFVIKTGTILRTNAHRVPYRLQRIQYLIFPVLM